MPLDPMVKNTIDQTIAALRRRADFRADPILTKHQSRMVSILSSAEKRHGRVIEVALRTSLAKSPHYTVWHEPKFLISRAADDATAQSIIHCLATAIPYSAEGYRCIELDIVAFDHRRQFLGSYEVKRGNGRHDSGKQKQIRRDLLATHVLLRSYGMRRNLLINHSSSRIVFYYGQGSIGAVTAQLSLSGAQLDEHFDWPVRADIELANNYYRDAIATLLEVLGSQRPTEQLSLFLPIRTGT